MSVESKAQVYRNWHRQNHNPQPHGSVELFRRTVEDEVKSEKKGEETHLFSSIQSLIMTLC
jgi:hypothetical protein